MNSTDEPGNGVRSEEPVTIVPVAGRQDLAEWAWVALVSSAILLFSSIPYLVGYMAQTTDYQFGGAVFDRQDYAVHLATMQLGLRGEWAYRLRFTSEDHPGAYVKLAYIFLGHVAGWTGLSLPATYQMARVLFGLAACLLIYVLAKEFFTRQADRRWAFLLVIGGSGLGWLQLMFGWLPNLGISPADFWMVDAYVFFGFLTFPHFAFVTALLTGMLELFLDHLRRPAWWKAALIVLAGALLQLVQPYAPLIADLVLAGSVLAVAAKKQVMPWNPFLALGAIYAAQIPLLVYNLVVFQSHPVWRAFASQNSTLSPPPIYYLLGFGLIWPLAILGAVKILRTPDPARWACLVWVVGVPALAYLPINIQRRFMLAYSLPLGLVASVGLIEVVIPWLHSHASLWVSQRVDIGRYIYLILCALSSIYLVSGTAWVIASGASSFFDPASLLMAVDWLATNSDIDDIVLSAELTGQVLAARTGLRVFFGHPIETIEYREKARQVEEFYTGRSTQDWLKNCTCQWVILGPEEMKISVGATPLADLQPVYDRKSVRIYRIRP